jgi:hypothetical protein
MRWALQILALVGITACGFAFLACIATLLLNYDYQHHRLMPFATLYTRYTLEWGLGLLCSMTLYLYVVRKMHPISK